ncbi:MAG: hypothetical protein PHE54_01565 [Bacilli bacterium]|nr:hypothetical protein [Bacilli bacterium]
MIKKRLSKLFTQNRANLIEIIIAIFLITLSLIILNDFSFILFGLGLLIITLVLLKINNK